MFYNKGIFPLFLGNYQILGRLRPYSPVMAQKLVEIIGSDFEQKELSGTQESKHWYFIYMKTSAQHGRYPLDCIAFPG